MDFDQEVNFFSNVSDGKKPNLERPQIKSQSQSRFLKESSNQTGQSGDIYELFARMSFDEKKNLIAELVKRI